MTTRRKRVGFALPLAVFMLAAIGSLAGAAFFAIREAQRSATRLSSQDEAASAADARLFALLSTWDAAERDSLRLGATDSTWGGAAASGGAESYVTRVTSDLYSVSAIGRSAMGTSAAAWRGHSLLIRLIRPTLALRGTIVSRGDVVVASETSLSGDDRPPPGWENCPPPDSASSPAVLLADGRSARDPEGHPLPDVQVDSLAGAPSTYTALGPATVAFLAERADIVFRGGAMVSPRPAVGDKCREDNDLASWGEPARMAESPNCQRYFPVIHAAGDIVVTAGRGQGVLLVDGRLRIQGPFLFAGVIAAGGGIETSGGSVSVYGAVLSGGVSGIRWASSGYIQRSTCAVFRALLAASRPVPVSRRGWSELF